MNYTRSIFGWLAASLLSASLHAADWPAYRGAHQDGISSEKININWGTNGPTVLWKAELGPSFSSFAVGGGRAFSFTQRKVDGEDREVAVAFDVKDGKELWAMPLGRATYDPQGGDGPRSTPALDGGRVYYLGAYQVLSCLDAKSGKVIWQHDLVKEYEGRIIKWKSAASPVIDGDLLFVNGGGTNQALLAFNKQTGDVAWKVESDLPTHSTPVPVTILGVRQIIFKTQPGLVSVAPATGAVLWRYAFPYKTSSGTTPVVWRDMVYCSSGYGVGAAVVRLSKSDSGFAVTELWRRKGELLTHWTTPVCQDGYLYGIYGHNERGTAPLKCVEMAAGREMWSEPGFGSGGATILVGGNVLVQSDRGPLVLAEASPKAYHELARAQVFGGQCWTAPAVSDGRMYARNSREAYCLDVKP